MGGGGGVPLIGMVQTCRWNSPRFFVLTDTVKLVLRAICIKQSSVFKGHLFRSHKGQRSVSLPVLTHVCLASHKRDIGKQCRPRSDAAERGV